MIEGLILWLMGRGFSEKIAKAVLIASAVLAAVALSATLKEYYDHRVIEQNNQKQVIENLKKDNKANDRAADQRAKDEIANANKDSERKEAISQTTDEAPSDSAVALGCVRLRQHGYDTSKFPACAGH